MEEWRALADTVLGTLVPVATFMTPRTLSILISVRRMLNWWVRMVIRVRRGRLVHILPDPWPPGVSPGGVLDLARRELGLLCDAHARAGNVFRLCRARLGGTVQVDPLWPVLERHRAAALHHAARAREALRSAAAHAQAAVPANSLTARLPPGSPERAACCSAALYLLRRAMWGATTAMVELRLMSEAVALECFYVYMILHRSPLHVRCLIEALRECAVASR